MTGSHTEETHGAILLAAGEGRRMGRVKQLLAWKDSTLIQHAINQLRQSDLDEIVVVLGANREEILRKTNFKGMGLVINEDWNEGMAGSLVSGLKALLKKKPGLKSVLIVLTDQPMLETNYYNQLLDRYKGGYGKIICSAYFNQLGVPVLFDSSFFPELLKLQGDKGAKALIKTLGADVAYLEVGEKGADLDTYEKYLHYCDLYGSQ